MSKEFFFSREHLIMSTSCVSRVAQSLVIAAALLPIVAVPRAVAASVPPPIPSPATVYSVSPTRTDLHLLVRGAVCQSPNTCTRVLYRPMNDPSGVAALQAALSTTSADKIVVFGYSEGATVVGKWLAQHIDDPNIPSPEVLSFVVVGNPTRASTGIAVANGVDFPQSSYQVIDVARQYDGVADFPNNPDSPYYFLAVRNATRGTLFGGLHNYSSVDIYDPANAVWTSEDGNTTYVLAPTQNVPILGGFANLFPEWNAQLKAEIETAYIRPVPFPTTTTPASTLPSAFAEPSPAPEHTTMTAAPSANPTTTEAGDRAGREAQLVAAGPLTPTAVEPRATGADPVTNEDGDATLKAADARNRTGAKPTLTTPSAKSPRHAAASAAPADSATKQRPRLLHRLREATKHSLQVQADKKVATVKADRASSTRPRQPTHDE